MVEHGAVRDEAAAVAEIGELLRRHGLRASADQIQRLVRPRQLLIEGMNELRQVLDSGLEPAPTFDSAEAAVPRGGASGR
jgi:hypothetical protein